ncbi:MAG: hypothetical protein IPI39_18470 [Candidatus Obscuribacter sp.]|nr:hypothetical protein [Candidatus Obscuribacter sp.]
MESFQIDYLVMLLSSDWFFAYWDSIGVSFDESTRRKLQQSCRQIVKQIMLDANKIGSQSYFDTTFSPQRLEETQNQFFKALENIKGKEVFAELLHNKRKNNRVLSDNDSWLLVCITKEFINGKVGCSSLSLSESSADLIMQYGGQFFLINVDYDSLCLNSITEWDCYLRSMSIDQPTYLSDCLSDILRAKSLVLFWRNLSSKLTPSLTAEIVNWYEEESCSRVNRRISLRDCE